MKKTWTVDVGGTRHTVEYKALFRRKLVVDGQETKLRSMNWFLNMIDEPVPDVGADVRLVVVGSKARLAVNGTYQEGGEPYVPLQKMPGIADVFIGLSVLGGYFLCGIWGMLIGILFSMLYVKLGLQGKRNALIAAFCGCTVIQFVIMFAVASLYIFSGLV